MSQSAEGGKSGASAWWPEASMPRERRDTQTSRGGEAHRGVGGEDGGVSDCGGEAQWGGVQCQMASPALVPYL